MKAGNPRDPSLIGPPVEDQPTRSVCAKCGGTGTLSELRVIWKKPRLDPDGEPEPPLKCSRRVEDSEQAAREMVELKKAGMLDVDCLAAAGPCACRQPAKAGQVVEEGKSWKSTLQPPDRDPKMRQANDF